MYRTVPYQYVNHGSEPNDVGVHVIPKITGNTPLHPGAEGPVANATPTIEFRASTSRHFIISPCPCPYSM